MKVQKSNSKHQGSSFDSWLSDQGEEFKADVIAAAMKRQFVIKLKEMMKSHGVGVNALQRRLGTGPSQVQRLLDPEDVGISLKSIAKLLAVFGASAKITIKKRPLKKKAA